MKKPSDYPQRETSLLLDDGIFTYFRDPGVPFYLPIGRNVLRNMYEVFLEEAETLGMSYIEIPTIMRDVVLEEGEDITDTFNERIVRLKSNSLVGFHLLTTPEPMILDLAFKSLNTHNQLPVRYVYNVDIVRGVQRPKGILKGRQFKTFMGNSLDADKSSLEESLKLFEELSDNIFEKLEVDIYKRRNQKGIDIEHFYFCAEGDNLVMPEIDSTDRVSALSLSMAYHYNPKSEIKTRFRNNQNKNQRVLYATFGLGTQRAFYALFDAHRDDRGFNLPQRLVPFRYSLIPTSFADIPKMTELYFLIKRKTILDDREKINFGDKAKFSDYVGVPWKIIYGNGTFTIKNRAETITQSAENTLKVMEILDRIENEE